MARFGGWSQFGSSAYGGQLSWSQRYYEIFKSIFLPGFWSLDDETIGNKLLRGDAKIAEHGQVIADALGRQVFPDTASETLSDWESLLGVVPSATANINDRRAGVLAKWRGAKPSSLPAIREALVDLLNPEYAWRDQFPTSDIFWFYDQDNASGLAIAVGDLQVTCSGACVWGAGAPRCSLPTNNQMADVSIAAHVNASSPSASGDDSYGVYLASDDDNAVLFGLVGAGGAAIDLRADQYSDGALTTDVLDATASEPVGAYWLVLQRSGDDWICSYGATLDALTELGRLTGAATARIRRLGVYGRNTASGAGSFRVFEMRVQYAVSAHNVTIREVDRDTATWGETATDGGPNVFVGTITRKPADAGSYDIRGAQGVADRMAQAHTLLLIGETDRLLCDDPYSLTDRDPLGV